MERPESERHFDGLLVGFLFTIGSELLRFTFIVPIIAVFPGVMIEAVVSGASSDKSNSSVGIATIVVLSVILIVGIAGCLFWIWRMRYEKCKVIRNQIILFMTLLFVFIHSLGFYIYWGAKLHFRGDGQLIFGAIDSFEYSSLAFLPIGLMMDLLLLVKKDNDS